MSTNLGDERVFVLAGVVDPAVLARGRVPRGVGRLRPRAAVLLQHRSEVDVVLVTPLHSVGRERTHLRWQEVIALITLNMTSMGQSAWVDIKIPGET